MRRPFVGRSTTAPPSSMIASFAILLATLPPASTSSSSSLLRSTRLRRSLALPPPTPLPFRAVMSVSASHGLDSTFDGSVLRVDASSTLTFSASASSFSSSSTDGSLEYSWDLDGDGTPDAGNEVTATRSYDEAGSYLVTLTVTDVAEGTIDETSTNVIVGNGPIPSISRTGFGSTFPVGETMTLRGTAADADGNAIAGGSLAWEARLSPGDEGHRDLTFESAETTATGNVARLSPIPSPLSSFEASRGYLQIRLTATDTSGRSSTIARRYRPRTIRLEVDSIPSGRRVAAYDQVWQTPAALDVWDGQSLELNAPEQFDASGTYTWKSWQDEGATSPPSDSIDESGVLRLPVRSEDGPTRRIVATFDVSSPSPTQTHVLLGTDVENSVAAAIVRGGKHATSSPGGYYLHLTKRGKLKLLQGAPGNPTKLLWTNDYETDRDGSYFAMLGNDGVLSVFEGDPASVSDIDVSSARTTAAAATVRWTSGTAGPAGDHFLSFHVDSNRIAAYRGDSKASTTEGGGTLVWSEGTSSPLRLRTANAATTGSPTTAASPSKSPTGEPPAAPPRTKRPTKPPTAPPPPARRPTERPTASPARNPSTPPPTPRPTKRPTASPARGPTSPPPTPRPTRRPTEPPPPTPRPTKPPTASPTPKPATPPPTPPPTKSPTASSGPSFLLLVSDEPISAGRVSESVPAGYYLRQRRSGELELHRGIPFHHAVTTKLLWRSGYDSGDNRDFYTALERDDDAKRCALVTREGTPSNPGKRVWSTADGSTKTTTTRTSDNCFLELDPTKKALSIYEGDHEDRPRGSKLWTASY